MKAKHARKFTHPLERNPGAPPDAHPDAFPPPLCSNPMAGTDATMLALTGAGYADGRTFGFASCERRAGAAEGMNVLMQRQVVKPGGGVEYAYNVTNVEYTEFERLGMSDEQAQGSPNSVLPANTNILYVSLKVRVLCLGGALLGEGHNICRHERGVGTG
jgi:hypothetical protein